jgi:hypothetical protein
MQHAAWLREQCERQRKWIQEHGGSEAGYCLRYGEADDADKYGDGGSAIYKADTDALARYEEELSRVTEQAEPYTIQPGRHVHRYGKPWLYIGKAEGTSPTDADRMARHVVTLLNTYGEG